MMEVFNDQYLWLITGIDIPMIMTVIWMVIRYYKENEKRMSNIDKMIEIQRADFDKQLMNYKLHVANEYARLSSVRDIEKRVVSHLLRIESKLDATALKAERIVNDRTI